MFAAICIRLSHNSREGEREGEAIIEWVASFLPSFLDAAAALNSAFVRSYDLCSASSETIRDGRS